MTLKEAVKILENHNKWRRDRSNDNKIMMSDPKQLGIAIDTVVKSYKLIDKLINRV